MSYSIEVRLSKTTPAIRILTCAALIVGCAPSFAAPDPTEDEFALRSEQFSKTSSAVRAAVPIQDSWVDTTAIASLDSRAGNFVRLESAFSLPLDDSAKRLRVGDSVSHPGMMGNAVRFAGLQFGTASSSRTDLLDASRLALSGTAIVPTAVDAMLAGKAKSTDRFAGRGLALQRAPQLQANGLSFAATDSVGQTNSFNRTLLPKYIAPSSGCDNYSVGVGRARVDYALTSNSYGPWFANSTVVCGLDSGLAMEAHGEFLAGETGVAGLSLFRPVGALGTASVSVATSDNERGSGWLLRVGLQHSNELFDLNLRAHKQSVDYREVGATIDGDSVAQRIIASAGAQVTSRSMLSLAYINQTTHGLQQTNTLAVSNKIELGSRGAISIAAQRAVDGKEFNDSSVTMSYSKKLKK